MMPATSLADASPGDRLRTWLAPLADAVVAMSLLRGIAAHGGEPATMLVAGRAARVGWLVDRFFAEAPRREPLGHVPAWRIARTLRRMRSSADLTVAHVARLSAARLGLRDDYLPVPDWIGMRIDAPFDVAASARASHSLADDLRRIRQRRWSAEVSHGSGELAGFYAAMYAPFTRARYGADAYVQPMRRARRAFRRGGILWVSHDGRRVAGCLFERRHDTLATLALGMAGGDPARMKEGAIAAMYLSLIDYARGAGCTHVDLRGSRPSLDDGLTRFKRKWGASVYDRPDVPSTTLVHWDRMSPVVEAFLANTSLVFRDGDGLSAVAVARPDGHAGAAVGRACHLLTVPGLRRRLVLTGAEIADARCACVAVPLASLHSGPRALLAGSPAGRGE